MLGNKKNNKKTVFGGIGIALLLCALMVLMPMSGYVDNNESAEAEFVEATSTGDEEDYFKLPETIAEEYEYDPFYDEEEEREKKEKEYRLYNEIGRKTFIPGLIILSVAYIGNKIKIGQKEIIINESDILLPKISDYFSRVEIQNGIGIYNWAKRNNY